MRILLAGLVAALAHVIAAAPPASAQAPAAATAKPYTMARNVQFDMTSKINGRTYRIFVHTPPLPAPPGGYPVLYVTDGNGTFPIAAGQAELETLAGGRMLVVGIGYATEALGPPQTLRNRDLTPSAPTTPEGGGQPAKPDEYGGAEPFYRFITEELRPAIAAAYRIDPKDQTLYGHSLGGLFTLNVLFRHPESFAGFAASSPSIWWNDREILGLEAAFSKAVTSGQAAPRILITVGGNEETIPKVMPPGRTEADFKDLLSARMVSNARELAGRLAQLKGAPGYEVRFQAFENEDHMSTMAASISRALVFAERR